jgi:NhaP-type Na+/H+ or K+/H+ antiporter
MIGTRLSFASVLFMGWFGPRGLGSIVLALVVAREVPAAEASLLRLGMIATVLLSIFAHGFSAAPAINAYAKQVEKLDNEAPERRDAARMPELRT